MSVWWRKGVGANLFARLGLKNVRINSHPHDSPRPFTGEGQGERAFLHLIFKLPTP